MEKTTVLNLNGESEFSQEVRQNQLPVLVDFWAPWCGPCQMMAPILEELATLMSGKIKIAKVDTEKPENNALANEFSIQSIPNLKLFQNGKVIGDFVGLRNLETLKKEIEELIK